MKIGAKKFLSLMLCCIMVLGLFPVTAFAKKPGGDTPKPGESGESKTVTIPFEKEWNDDSDVLGNRPNSITVSLYRVVNKKDELIESVVVTALNDWEYVFSVDKDKVVDANGNPFKLKVDEGFVEGYKETAHTDPVITYTPFSVGNWDREKTCSSKNFPSVNTNVIVVKGTGNTASDYVIWTKDTGIDQDKIIQSASKIEGFNSITNKNTTIHFINGFGENNSGVEYSGITITSGRIEFTATSGWAQFATGTYTEEAINVTGASITNTYKEDIPTAGSLTITKRFENLPEKDYPESVNFTVTGPNSYSQTVTLPDNNQWTTTLSNLTTGDYTVSENKESAEVDGYILAEQDKKLVTVTAGQNDQITFTNIYEAQQEEDPVEFSIFVDKIVKKGGDVDPGAQTFTFELVGEEGKSLNDYGITITGNTIDTNGVNIYNGQITGTVDPNKVTGSILWSECEVPESSDKYYSCTLTLKENNGGVAGWDYSVEQYNVTISYYPETPAKSASVNVIVDLKNNENCPSFTNTYTVTSTSESKPESKPIRDTVTIEIGNNGKPEETNPDTGAPLMFAPVMAAALAAAVVVKRKK